MTQQTRRRPGARWFLIAGILLVGIGVVGGFGAIPIGALAFPLGLVALLVASLLSLRRPPEVRDLPPQGQAERRGSFSLRLLLLGLAMVVVAALIAIAFGNVANAGVFVLPVGISVVLGVAVVLSGRLFLLAMVLGAMLLMFSLGSFELELEHPESFGNFAPALWMTVGWAVAFGAATAAFLQRRRRTLRPVTSRQRWVVLIGLALLVAGSMASWFASGASRVTAANAKGATVVEMHDNEFSPNELNVERGETARFYLVNTDSEPHTFTVDELALDEYIGPLGERLISFDVPEATKEDLELICVVTGHEDMDGEIGVEPG